MPVGLVRIASQFSPMECASSPTLCRSMLPMPSIATGRTIRLVEALVILVELPCSLLLIQVSIFPYSEMLLEFITINFFTL